MNKHILLLLLSLLINHNNYAQVCPQFGDLIITEIMQNPATVSDAVGEYFEIYNRVDTSFNLQHLTVRDNGTNEFIITDSVVIAPNSYFIFCRNDDPNVNGGFMVDYVYSGFSLGNSDDQIIIECNGQLIDSVAYDGGSNFPDPNGGSMNLSPDAFDPVANDDGSNWCITSERINAAGDFGTPGQANTLCTPELCAFSNVNLTTSDCIENDLTFEVSFEVTSSSGFYEMVNLNTNLVLATGVNSPLSAKVLRYSEEGDFSVVIRDALNPSCTSEVITFSTERCTPPRDCPTKGDLIITEIMQNPQAVMDDMGEYFELYNPTPTAINLQDMSIHDADGQKHFILEPVMIAADGYAVLGINADTLTNGGIPVNYQYQNFILGNASDEIILRCNNMIIDSVGYDDGLTFPDPNGASMELKIDFLNTIENDNGANWIISECQLQEELDAGTPGRSQDNCMTVSINETVQSSEIIVFPNPNNGSFYLQNLPNNEYNYQVFNHLGKIVSKGRIIPNEQFIFNQSTGIYYLQIQNDKGWWVEKIVIR